MELSRSRRLLLLTAFLTAIGGLWIHRIIISDQQLQLQPTSTVARPQLTASKHRHANEAPQWIFGGGFGSTATHAVFKATCQLRLRSLHYEKQCGIWKNRRLDAQDPELPPPAVLAHERLLRAHRALKDCVASADGRASCPTVREAADGMLRHIDLVISNVGDGDALHDTPYPEFAEYVMEASRRIHGAGPLLLLSERDPQVWSQKRVSHDDDLVCKLSSAKYSTDSSPKYLGQNIYWCLQTALENNMHDSSVRDVFWNVHQLYSQPEKRAEILQEGYKLYRDAMRFNNPVYQVDLFQRTKQTSTNLLATEISIALKNQTILARARGRGGQVVRRTPDFNTQKGCMQDHRTAFSSGRFCDKLVLFLHFHKAGGSSIIQHFIDRGLWYDLGTNIDDAHYGTFEEGKDVTFGGYGKNHLKIHSSANQTRVSRPDFWESIYRRGIDVVNLEYNFLPPDVYLNMQLSFWKMTQLREPWSRYRSTYERELYIKCRGEKDREKCFKSNSLKSWMINHKAPMTGKREEEWICILCSNYYTRLLNGMGDYPREALITREHLEAAKAILDTFDVVMILEDSDDTNLNNLVRFFGTMNEEMPPIPHETNNKLKEEKALYDLLRDEIVDPMQKVFREQNQLDIELFEYARERFTQQAPAQAPQTRHL